MEKRQMEELAAVVHGTLAALHILSCLYNIRRRNVVDTLVHGAAAAYDLNAVRIHVNALKGLSR